METVILPRRPKLNKSCVLRLVWGFGVFEFLKLPYNLKQLRVNFSMSSKEENGLFKEDMQKIWTISDFRDTSFCVGIAIKWDCIQNTVHLSQTATLIDCIVVQFGQKDSYPTTTPIDLGLKL